MKLKQIYLNSEVKEDGTFRFSMSYGRPEFQGGESIDIDEDTFNELSEIKK